MKYLFVFLLIGLVSCGDASGEATKVSKANVNSHINENTDWTKILKCDDIVSRLSQSTGYTKDCSEDGWLNSVSGYRNSILVSKRVYSTINNLRYLESERFKLDSNIECSRFYRVYKGKPYLYEERFRKNGKPYGTNREWAERIDNHPLVREATFDVNGNPIKDTRWRENGELFELYELSSPGTYLLKKWGSATNLILEENFVNYQRDGLRRTWYGDGQLEYEGNYKDGEVDGLHRSWHENGGLWEESNYKDGKPYGLHKSWYENGQLSSEHIYKDGKRDGLSRYWRKNGQLSSEQNWKDGYKDGLVRSWSEDGQLEDEWNYKVGKRDGLSRYWHTNGQLRIEYNYKDGKKDGLLRRWYYNGQLKSEAHFKNGNVISAKCFDEDGNLTKCD